MTHLRLLLLFFMAALLLQATVESKPQPKEQFLHFEHSQGLLRYREAAAGPLRPKDRCAVSSSLLASERLQLGLPIKFASANERQLAMIPGVGPATAQRLISFRQSNFPVRAVQSLEKIAGIGRKTTTKLDNWLCFD